MYRKPKPGDLIETIGEEWSTYWRGVLKYLSDSEVMMVIPKNKDCCNPGDTAFHGGLFEHEYGIKWKYYNRKEFLPEWL